MLALCEQIKGSGIAPWITTGVHPQYIQDSSSTRCSGSTTPQAMINIDNLEEDAWKSPAVADVLEALYQLAERDYFAEGWEGLDHTQSQAEWLQGKAAFLPCGSWLENEMGASIPDGFNMVVAPTPSLDGDKCRSKASSRRRRAVHRSRAGQNVQGGKEWLRLLFSKEGGRFFAESTKSLTVVNGAGEGLDLGTAFARSRRPSRPPARTPTCRATRAGTRSFSDEAKCRWSI